MKAPAERPHYFLAGKSQNLSDVRSEACAVDWFSYYAGYSLLMNLEEDERFIFVWLMCLRFANNESAKMSIKSSFMEIVFSLCIQQNEVPGQNSSILELTTDSNLLALEEKEGRCEANKATSVPHANQIILRPLRC